jgi:hypothetical protein
MVLTKEAGIGKVQHEVRILLHLISKVGPVILRLSSGPKSQNNEACGSYSSTSRLGRATRFRAHSSLIKREEKHHE